MSTGLKSVHEDFKKNSSTFTPSVKQLKIYKDEIAFVNFLATGDDKDHRFQSYSVHEEKENDRFLEIFCTSDDSGLCERCLHSRSKPRFGVWVWVDKVLRKFQNPAYTEGREGAKPWKLVKYGTGEDGKPNAFYVQEVDDVRLWTKGPGRNGYIINQLLTAYNNYSTLMDRQYSITRKGERLETNYSVEPFGDKRPLSDKQLSIYSQLPSVNDVLSGKTQWPPKRENTVVITEEDEVDEFDPSAPIIQEPDAIEVELEDEEVEESSSLNTTSELDDAQIKASIESVMGSLDNEPEPVVRRTRRS